MKKELSAIDNGLYKLFLPHRAEALVKELAAAEEDGWTYEAKFDEATGWSKVLVFDETGAFAGTF